MKVCEQCGSTFARPYRVGNALWAARRYCSRSCAGAARIDGRSLADRIWPHVDKSDGPSGCWPWTGYRNPAGYGQVSHAGVHSLAHRAVWTLVNGPIRDGLLVCHRCDNPPCVNPAHLYVGTQADNMRDAARAGTMRRDVRGDRNPARKLSLAAVEEIRALRALGFSHVELATLYGVDRTTVSLAARGKTWNKEIAA